MLCRVLLLTQFLLYFSSQPETVSKLEVSSDDRGSSSPTPPTSSISSILLASMAAPLEQQQQITTTSRKGPSRMKENKELGWGTSGVTWTITYFRERPLIPDLYTPCPCFQNSEAVCVYSQAQSENGKEFWFFRRSISPALDTHTQTVLIASVGDRWHDDVLFIWLKSTMDTSLHNSATNPLALYSIFEIFYTAWCFYHCNVLYISDLNEDIFQHKLL